MRYPTHRRCTIVFSPGGSLFTERITATGKDYVHYGCTHLRGEEKDIELSMYGRYWKTSFPIFQLIKIKSKPRHHQDKGDSVWFHLYQKPHHNAFREGTFSVNGSKLFNILPPSIRNLRNVGVETFKRKLDEFLATIPDEPQSPGYTLFRRADTNSLLHMVPALKQSYR